MKRTTRSRQQRLPHKARLTIERLEDRSLLAVAAFMVNLYHDAGGFPGELIVDDTVSVGESFFVEIMAREYDPLAAGLRGVALDIAWDPDVLAVIDEPFDPSKIVTPDLPVFVSGTLNRQSGRILDLGGSAFLSSNVGRAIGNLAPDRFALLNFRALQPAENSPLKMKQGQSRIVTVPTQTLRTAALYFEPQTITVLPSVTGAEESIVHPTLVFEGIPAEVTGEPTWVSHTPSTLDTPAGYSFIVSEPDSPEITEMLAPATPPSRQTDTYAALPQPSETDTHISAPELPLEPLGESSSDPTADGQRSPVTTPGAKWHNPQNPVDVDGTGRVAAVDVVIIVNYLNNSPGRWELPAVQTTPPRYLDVNGDGDCTPHDAVLVINYIDRRAVPAGEGEFSPPSVTASDEVASDAVLAPAVTADYRPMVVLPIADRRGRDSTAVKLVHPAQRVGTAVREALHVAASLRDGKTGFGETGPREAAADEVFRTRRIATEISTDLEDILPDVAAGWFRAA